MTPSIRTGCAVCAEPFVHGDFPNIVAWTDPDGMQCAAHETCLGRLGEPVVSSN